MRLPALLILAISAAPAARAEHVEVRMLNRGPAGSLVFEPDSLHLQPGDTVTFRATDRTHNAASIPGMLPPGARPFKGQIDQEIEIAFDTPGRYGIRCIPHSAMGMVMLIQVGPTPATPEPLPDDLPQEARDRFLAILARQDAK